MKEVQDKIGVVRQHRWINAAEQERILRDRCRIVVSLGGGKAKLVTLAELAKLTRPGTVVELVHVYLLADPKRKRAAGGMKADLRAAIALLVDKRGGVLVDVETGLTTAQTGQRKALIALAEDQISRSNKGLKSALNGAKSKGRPKPDYTPQQLADAKAIWRNLIDYPEWKDTKAPLKQIVSPNGIAFTPERAYTIWKKRTKPKK